MGQHNDKLIGRTEMADIQQLEEQIVGLSLLDAAQLVKKLEEEGIINLGPGSGDEYVF